MKFRRKTVTELAEMICGNPSAHEHFNYRTGRELDDFFEDASADEGYCRDLPGLSRRDWTESVLEQILAEPWLSSTTPSETFAHVIALLMDQEDAKDEPSDRPGALAVLNRSLNREKLDAFYGPDGKCYLRNKVTGAVSAPAPSPHRPFTTAEVEKRERLSKYLGGASEDELIEDVLLPLFRQVGFHRITAAGHKDKALEFGKDIWMRYQLPTQHFLYFGLQVKKDKLDSAGRTREGNANVAEVLNQAQMMLAHEIFDPEVGRTVLVDHAFIVAGGEITKAARSFIGRALDSTRRSQIMFIDREDILNLYIVNNLPLPTKAQPPPDPDPWGNPPF